MNHFSQEINREIAFRLKKLGFKKKNKYPEYYKQWDENTYMYIFFGMTSFQLPKHRYVNPRIGVCYIDINKLESQLSEKDTDDWIQPTISEGLSYIMPCNTFKEWDFTEGEDNESVYEDMFNAIKTYGFSYITQKDRHSRIVDFFKTREKAGHQILSISYFLNGEKEKGLQVFNEFLERISRRPTDEEIRMGTLPEKALIIRAGESGKMTGKEMGKKLNEMGSGGRIIIIGSGYNGEIDPAYLKFVENYMKLPEKPDNQNN